MFSSEGNISASQPTGPTGKELLKKHIKTAVSKKKMGYVKSAAYGAATGAMYAIPISTGIDIAHNSPQHAIDEAYRLSYEPSYMYSKGKIVETGMSALNRLLIHWVTVGAIYGAIWSMWREAFYRNSTPEWIEQLQELNKSLQGSAPSLSKKVMYLGVPNDKKSPALEQGGYIAWFKNLATRSKYVRKAYLLSSAFDDISQAFDPMHYELYLMPKDEYLVDVFLAVHDFCKKNKSNLTSTVSFIAMRPTPGVTKSPYNSKNLPRIIIGFKNSATKDDVIDMVQALNAHFEQAWLNYQNIISLNVQPRYSQKLNDLIYAAYGSADYKDSALGMNMFRYKAKTLFQRWWSGASDDDMAYFNSSVELPPLVLISPIPEISVSDEEPSSEL